MDNVRKTAKDTVRERSENMCEKCKQILTVTLHGFEPKLTDRTIHHRQPQRHGGRHSIINMVNLCIKCHRGIHEDEKKAASEGWIVINRFPGSAPFFSWRGWVLPKDDGSLTLLDFGAGRTAPLTSALRERAATTKRRKPSSHRPRRETRKSSRYFARTA